MAVNLGSVNVQLVATTAKFVKGMTDARKSLQKTSQATLKNNKAIQNSFEKVQKQQEVAAAVRKKLDNDEIRLLQRKMAADAKYFSTIKNFEESIIALRKRKKAMIKGNSKALMDLRRKQKTGSKEYKRLLAENVQAEKNLREAVKSRSRVTKNAAARRINELKKIDKAYESHRIRILRSDHALARLAKRNKELSASMMSAKAQMSKFGKALKMGIAGAAAAGAAAGLMAIAAAARALGDQLVSSSKKAARFEHQLKKLEAVTTASQAEMFDLRDKALEMSKKFGVSADEVADGMSFMGMAGMKASEILTGIESVMKLSTIGMMDFGRAADIATNIMTQWNVPASQLTDVVDVMSATITSSNTNMTQMGDAMKYVAPIAKASGVSIEETAAAIGLLGNAGIQGEMGGTALRNALSRLQNPSKKSAKLLEALGVTVTDASGKMRPFIEVMYEFEAAGITADEALQLFGQRAGPAMVSILEQGVKSLDAYAFSLTEVEGVADRISNEILKSFESRLKKVKAAANEAAITIGTELNRAFIVLGESVIKSFGDTDKFIKMIRDETRELIAVLLRLGSAVKGFKESKSEQGVAGFWGIGFAAGNLLALKDAVDAYGESNLAQTFLDEAAAADEQEKKAKKVADRIKELTDLSAEYGNKLPKSVAEAIATFENLDASQKKLFPDVKLVVDALVAQSTEINTVADAAYIAEEAFNKFGGSLASSGDEVRNLRHHLNDVAPKLSSFLGMMRGALFAGLAVTPKGKSTRAEREAAKRRKEAEEQKKIEKTKKDAGGLASHIQRMAKATASNTAAEYKNVLATLKARIKMFKAQGKADGLALHQNEDLIATKRNLIQMEYLRAQTAKSLNDEKHQAAALEQKGLKLAELDAQIQASKNETLKDELKQQQALLEIEKQRRKENRDALIGVAERYKESFDPSVVEQQVEFLNAQKERLERLNDEETRSVELAAMHNEELTKQLETYKGMTTVLSDAAIGYINVSDALIDVAQAADEAARKQAEFAVATSAAAGAGAVQAGIFDLVAEKFGDSPAEKQKIKGAGKGYVGVGETVLGVAMGLATGDFATAVPMIAGGVQGFFEGVSDFFTGSAAEDALPTGEPTRPESVKERQREREDTTKSIVDALKEAGLYRPDIREQTLQFFGSDVLSLQGGRNRQARAQRVLQEVNVRDRF
jgi:TP901 family phage tail tape measure protein